MLIKEAVEKRIVDLCNERGIAIVALALPEIWISFSSILMKKTEKIPSL